MACQKCGVPTPFGNCCYHCGWGQASIDDLMEQWERENPAPKLSPNAGDFRAWGWLSTPERDAWVTRREAYRKSIGG